MFPLCRGNHRDLCGPLTPPRSPGRRAKASHNLGETPPPQLPLAGQPQLPSAKRPAECGTVRPTSIPPQRLHLSRQFPEARIRFRFRGSSMQLLVARTGSNHGRGNGLWPLLSPCSNLQRVSGQLAEWGAYWTGVGAAKTQVSGVHQDPVIRSLVRI